MLGKAPALEQLFERGEIDVHIAHEGGDAVDQLRNERAEQEQQERHDRDDRKRRGERPAEVRLLHPVKQPALIELGEWVH